MARSRPSSSQTAIGVMRFLNAFLFLWCVLGQARGAAVTANAERARAILKQGVEAKDPDVRVQAVVAASMVGRNEGVLKRLEVMLQDKDVQVRTAAIRTLAGFELPESKGALEKTLKEDQVPEVRFAAAKALYALHDPAGEKALMDIYDGKISPNSSLLKKRTRSFIREFHSVESGAMFIVSQGIGYVPVPGVGEGFTAMTDLLADPDLSARATVLLLLGKEKDQQSLELIKRGLTDSDWSVRASAAQLIAHTAQAEMRDLLIPLFDDKKEKVRFRAAGAYLHLYLRERK
jgi:HEAT repeat protein